MFRNAQDADKLWTEITAAEAVRDDRLQQRKSRLARLAGPYADRQQMAEYEPENRLYEFVSYTLPRTSFSNPRVRMRSRAMGVADMIARAMQATMNRLIIEQQLRRVIRRNALDYLMDYGPVLITPTEQVGIHYSGRPVWWPQMYPLQPSHFGMDPLADCLERARYAFHVFARDKDELLAEAEQNKDDWNVDAVRDLTEEAGMDKVVPDRRGAPPRGEVVLYEVWVPELHDELDVDPDDGYSGTLYTVACSKGSQYEEPYLLRKPRPYFGPRWGPYRCAAFLTLEDLPYGLSPTIAAEAQLRDLAATSRTLLRNAKRSKTATTVPAGDPIALQAAQSEDGLVIPLKGSPEAIKVLQIGGVSQQDLVHFQMKAQTLDRVLGMADIQRGLVSGEGTASEVLTAQAASDIRTQDIVQVFHDHIADCLRTLAWYAYHDDRFYMRLSEQDLPVPLPKPTFQGGKTEGMTFDDLELEIEPYSMSHESEAQRQQRTSATIEIVGWLAQTIPVAPWMPWENIIPEIVEDAGVKEALEKIDVKAAVEHAAKMAGTEVEGKERPKVVSGREASGKPINVGARPPQSAARPQGQNAAKPARTAQGGFSVPKPSKAGGPK